MISTPPPRDDPTRRLDRTLDRSKFEAGSSYRPKSAPIQNKILRMDRMKLQDRHVLRLLPRAEPTRSKCGVHIDSLGTNNEARCHLKIHVVRILSGAIRHILERNENGNIPSLEAIPKELLRYLKRQRKDADDNCGRSTGMMIGEIKSAKKEKLQELKKITPTTPYTQPNERGTTHISSIDVATRITSIISDLLVSVQMMIRQHGLSKTTASMGAREAQTTVSSNQQFVKLPNPNARRSNEYDTLLLDRLIKMVQNMISDIDVGMGRFDSKETRSNHSHEECRDEMKASIGGNKEADCKENKDAKEKTIVILVLGIGGSGKTTLISRLKEGASEKCSTSGLATTKKNHRPTMGFRPTLLKYKCRGGGGGRDTPEENVHDLMTSTCTIKLCDIGGSSKIRGIWQSYYQDAHAIIYLMQTDVATASCATSCGSSELEGCGDELSEAMNVAVETLDHKYVKDKPLLIILNKTVNDEQNEIKCNDLSLHTPNLDEIAKTLVAKTTSKSVNKKNRMVEVVETSLQPATVSGKTQRNIGETRDATRPITDESANVDNSIEWLIQTVRSNFQELDRRVRDEKKEVKMVRQKIKEEKEHRLLQSCLSKAFGLFGEEVADTFENSDEGEEFMSHEVGYDNKQCLPDIGRKVCHLVGYQKFAMMICAKRKRKESWEKVLEYVSSVRAQLGLIE